MSTQNEKKVDQDTLDQSSQSTAHLNKSLFSHGSSSTIPVQPSCQTLVDQLQLVSVAETIGRSLGNPESYSWSLNLDELYSYNYPSFYHQIVELHPPWASVYDNIVQKDYSPTICGFVDRDTMIVILTTSHFAKKCGKLRMMDPSLPPDKNIVRELRVTLNALPNNCILMKRDPSTNRFKLQLDNSERHSARHQHLHISQPDSQESSLSSEPPMGDDPSDLDGSVLPSYDITCLQLPTKNEILKIIAQEYELDHSVFQMITSDYYADVSSS